jgi:hypothetical protein
MRNWIFALAVAALGTGASASTVPLQLYNTGVDNSGNTLGDYATDPHYAIVSAPVGSSTVDQVQAGWPVGSAWLGEDGSSRWVRPANPDTNDPAGYYTFQTTFNLPANVNVASVFITGQWSTDNNGIGILINGTNTVPNPNDTNPHGVDPSKPYSNTSPDQYLQYGYDQWTPFKITSNEVHAGINTLDFVVYNWIWPSGGNPTGLRVEMAGYYTLASPPVVPLPSTVFSGGLLLAGLVVGRIRRFSRVS